MSSDKTAGQGLFDMHRMIGFSVVVFARKHFMLTASCDLNILQPSKLTFDGSSSDDKLTFSVSSTAFCVKLMLTVAPSSSPLLYTRLR